MFWAGATQTTVRNKKYFFMRKPPFRTGRFRYPGYPFLKAGVKQARERDIEALARRCPFSEIRGTATGRLWAGLCKPLDTPSGSRHKDVVVTAINGNRVGSRAGSDETEG